MKPKWLSETWNHVVQQGARLCLCVACASVGAGCSMDVSRSKSSPTDLRAASPLSGVLANRKASVVEISTLRIGRDQSEGDINLEFAPEHNFAERLAAPLRSRVRISEIRDLASGVVLSTDGYIVTSAHAVREVDDMQVTLADGRQFTAHLVGIDGRTDVALLKIEAQGLSKAMVGDSTTVEPGDPVAAMGAPFGFAGSVTAGVISAKDRFIAGAGEVPFIQTDVAINPGSSGGPLFNERGEVIGINSMIYSSGGGYMGLSFAIPINLVVRTASELRAHGRVRRAHLGAEFQELTPLLAQSFGLSQRSGGALVVAVLPASPAGHAGLKAGDVVTAVEGVPIAHHWEAVARVGRLRPGVPVRLKFWRGGTEYQIEPVLEEGRSLERRPRVVSVSDRYHGLGLTLERLAVARLRQLRLEGALLVRDSSGPARGAGVRAGDLLLAINARSLHSIEDFQRALSDVPAGEPVALLIMRDRRRSYLPVRAAAQAEWPPAPHPAGARAWATDDRSAPDRAEKIAPQAP